MSTNAVVARRAITAPGAPPAVGPDAHDVRHGDLEQALRLTVYTTGLGAVS